MIDNLQFVQWVAQTIDCLNTATQQGFKSFWVVSKSNLASGESFGKASFHHYSNQSIYKRFFDSEKVSSLLEIDG
jgi:hypothetical protein